MKLISLTIAMLTIMLASGCSVKKGAIKTVGFIGGNSTDTTIVDLEESGIKMSKKKKIEFKKDKGYIIFSREKHAFSVPTVLFEDVGNGKLALAGYMPESDASIVMEFDAGKHTLVGNSARGAYRTTFEIEPGYVYYIKKHNLGKESVWEYGGGQTIYWVDRDRLNESIETNSPNYFKNNAYVMVASDLEKANVIIKNSETKKAYDRFIKWHNEFPEDEKEDDVFYKYTDYTFDIKDAWKIPEKYFKN